jgi:hypothetical protein
MRFADPDVCPDCRGAIDGPTCPTCGLDLTDPQVRELWQTLLHADALLGAATARRDTRAAAAATPRRASAPASERAPGSASSGVTDLPSFPAPAVPADPPPSEPSAAPGRSWSVGTVLLVLGAVGLVTAAIIFVSRSWDSIGLVGKSLVLAAATAAVVGVAVWVTRRPLRASAEALWAVALALVALDVGGARSEGLFALDDASGAWVAAIAGALIAAAAGLVLRWSRPHVGAALVTPAVAAVLAVGASASGAALVGDHDSGFWHVLVGLLVAGGLGLVLRFTGSAVVAIGCRVVVGAFYVVAAAFAVVETVDHPSLGELVGDLHGLPLLVVALAALGVATAVPVLRVPMTAVATTALGVWVLVPSAWAGDIEGGWLAVSVVAVVLAAAGLSRAGSWSTGLRWGAGVPVVVQVGLGVWWVSGIVDVAARALDGAATLAATDRVDDVSRQLELGATLGCAAALVLVSALVTSWPAPHGLVVARLPAVATASAVGVAGVLVAARPPWWAAALVLVALTAALTVLARRLDVPALLAPAAATAAAALAVATADSAVWAVAWLVLGAAAAGLAVADGEPWTRRVAGVVAAPLAVTGAGAAAHAVGGRPASITLTAIVVAALAIVPVGVARPAPPARVPLEVGAGVALLVATCTAESVRVGALGWALVGTALAVVAMTTADRRWYAWPSVGAFAVAYVLLVVDTGFSFVEAYTLPPAAATLAGGVLLLRRRPETGSWSALGPGLALTMLPSLPQALADPTGLRALLLGLAGVVVLAVGLRVGRQAPFLLGAGVALLVVLCNIGPYANAAPRVVVISVVSAALVAVGITWEDRVRDGRRLVGFVRQLR